MYKKILMLVYLSCFLKTYSLELETSFLLDLKNKINNSIETLLVKEESITPSEDLQFLCNLFLLAANYSKYDIKVNNIKKKLSLTILEINLTTNSSSQNKMLLKKLTTLSNKLNDYEKKINQALHLWNTATNHLDKPEQKHVVHYMQTIAQERIVLLNDHLTSNNEEFNTLVMNLKTSIQKSASQTNTLGNYLQALKDDALPKNQRSTYLQLEKLEDANAIMTYIHKEALSLTENVVEFSAYYDSFLKMSKIIDRIYYQELYAIMINNSNNNQPLLMFDERGFIPEDKRTELLPHDVN